MVEKFSVSKNSHNKFQKSSDNVKSTRLCGYPPKSRLCHGNSFILEAVAKLEKLGFTSYLLAVPENNKRMLKGQVPQVKKILGSFSYPYNRRIAGQHGHFTMEDYQKWLKKAEKDEFARALRHLAQLNQSKVYLFWKR